MTEDMLTALRRTFQVEAEEMLTQLEDHLLSLSEGRREAEVINGLFRAAHTIKGSAMSVELTQLGELAHVVEELFSRWRDEKITPSSSQVSWALGAVEMLRAEMSSSLRATSETNSEETSESTTSSEQTIGVSIQRLDKLMDLIGELVINRGRVTNCLSHEGSALAELRNIHEDSEHLYSELQDRVMGLRLVPLQPTLRRIGRTAKDVAEKLGKEITFSTDASEMELDATIVDNLRDPLMHMVRNSVDHGVELPELRQQSGKAPSGRINLNACRQGAQLVLTLSDDGAGLNRSRLAEKAREAGLDVTRETITNAMMTDLIFRPGFSTAAKVTDVSGRGVGMDVVRESIERLRGTISLESVEGEGTTFTIRVPLALAIMEGFRFEIGGRSFVIPAQDVVECLDNGSVPERNGSLIELRGRSTPRIALRDIFQVQQPRPTRASLLLVEHTSGPVALEVDRLIGREQTVIKPLGPFFESYKAVAGSAVLGSGDVAVILDAQRLIDEIIQTEAVA